MTISQLVLTGDSLTDGTGPGGQSTSIAQGGKGSWVELVAEKLADIPSIGPLLSSGMRGVWLGILAGGDSEWSFAGSWTTVLSTDAWDKAPYGQGQYANGSSNIATATLPSQYRAAVGFAIYWADYTNGGNWSYRINGGAWTAMGQVLVNDNKLCKFYVASAVTPGQAVDIRCANAAGTGVGCFPVGIEWFYSTATTGLIVHNLGVNGTKLNGLCTSTSGDRLAWFDAVKLGTGSPISNQPNSGVSVMHINDVLLANTTTWNTDLTTFYNRVSPLGLVGITSPWEAATATYNQTQQTNYRAQTKTSAAALGAKTYDLYDAWSANGFTANAGAVTAGYLNADAVHQSQAGHIKIAEQLYWFVRNQILGLGAVPTAYPSLAKAAATTYTGKQTAVAYTAGAPVAVA